MKIEVWSDYACPFCYIGEKRLQRALNELGNDIEVEFKSFELDPNASKEVISSTAERFAEKYGLSLENATKRIEAISLMGRNDGIDFKYLTTRYTNTFDALKTIAGECGLDAAEVEKFLASDEFAAEVRADEREAAAYGIHAVPYFVINGKYAINGAQPTELIAATLEKILAEEPDENFSGGMACDADGCR